jgi:tripartite-type tricarboxylate transporter receptor subunit TctC
LKDHVSKLLRCCGVACVLMMSANASAQQSKPQNYPTRPIRLVIAVLPGAGADLIARAAAQMLTERLGQNVVVDNRAGGGGVIATETVARAAPDGYTILSQGETVLLQGITKRVPFDVLTTFEPIVGTSMQPYVLVVGLNFPPKNVKELIAYSQTSQVAYSGSAGIGTGVHLGMEHFKNLSGAKLLFVPYKGSAPSIIAVMGGEIQMAAASALAASAAIRTGKVRAFATLGLTRIPAMPDLPTVAEQGYPGFKITNRYTLMAPAGTPKDIIRVINQIVTEGMNSPAMAKRLEADGSQPAERMTPEELRATLTREYAELDKQVKAANIKL